jgi:hypothetical protein
MVAASPLARVKEPPHCGQNGFFSMTVFHTGPGLLPVHFSFGIVGSVDFFFILLHLLLLDNQQS